MRVLVVKTSSLGDVVHALPAVTDAAAALGPDVVFDWVVEEAFAPIPARHPAVTEVVPLAWRRWRRNLPGSRRALAEFRRRLRSQRYDVVLDAQGLIKSAVVTALARGHRKAGFSRRSAREGVAALAYHQGIDVPRDRHAVDRLRALFAAALGYRLPDGPPRFGIASPVAGEPAEAPPRRRCLLLHGTTWQSKLWPLAFWQETARRAAAAGFAVELPWGNDAERARAEAIAARAPARLLERGSLEALVARLAGADLVVGVDSGLAHLAGALEVPAVVLYGSTSSSLTGCRGPRVVNLAAEFSCAPCLRRTCGYRGPERYWRDVVVRPPCFGELPPERVWDAARELIGADRVLPL
jgi:heptosyltransferase-1